MRVKYSLLQLHVCPPRMGSVCHSCSVAGLSGGPERLRTSVRGVLVSPTEDGRLGRGLLSPKERPLSPGPRSFGVGTPDDPSSFTAVPLRVCRYSKNRRPPPPASETTDGSTTPVVPPRESTQIRRTLRYPTRPFPPLAHSGVAHTRRRTPVVPSSVRSRRRPLGSPTKRTLGGPSTGPSPERFQDLVPVGYFVLHSEPTLL